MHQPRHRPTKWVSDQWLADYYSVSRCTVWRWSKIGKLPQPQKIGENCTRWDFEAISGGQK